jgi:predicted transport protein
MPCSKREVEKDLIFCPYLLGCVRKKAPICEICSWDNPSKEEELYFKFTKHLEEVKANLARETPTQIDEFWWEARIEPVKVEAPVSEIKAEIEIAEAKPETEPEKEKVEEIKPSITIDYHLRRLSEDLKETILRLRSEILKLDSGIEEKINKTFIGYKSVRMKHYFVHLKALPLKHEIEVRFRSGGPIEDPEGLSKPIPKSFDTPMDRRVRIASPDKIPYVINLLKQAYENLTKS